MCWKSLEIAFLAHQITESEYENMQRTVNEMDDSNVPTSVRHSVCLSVLTCGCDTLVRAIPNRLREFVVLYTFMSVKWYLIINTTKEAFGNRMAFNG